MTQTMEQTSGHAPERVGQDETLAHLENDWRDAFGLIGELQEVEGISPDSSLLLQESTDKKITQASELLATIQEGGEDADGAKAALLELESEPAGYRAGWSKAVIESNARSAGLDYLKDGYDELAEDPAHLQTAIFAGQIANLIAAKPGDEQKFASWNITSFAREDRIGEEDFRAAVRNVYPMLRSAKNDASQSVRELGGRDGVDVYGSETITKTSTPYGLTVDERTYKFNNGRPEYLSVYIYPTSEGH